MRVHGQLSSSKLLLWEGPHKNCPHTKRPSRWTSSGKPPSPLSLGRCGAVDRQLGKPSLVLPSSPPATQEIRSDEAQTQQQNAHHVLGAEAGERARPTGKICAQGQDARRKTQGTGRLRTERPLRIAFFPSLFFFTAAHREDGIWWCCPACVSSRALLGRACCKSYLTTAAKASFPAKPRGCKAWIAGRSLTCARWVLSYFTSRLPTDAVLLLGPGHDSYRGRNMT